VRRSLLLIAVLGIFLVAGCVGEVAAYTDPGQTISIGVNQEFVIALGSNQTTGYSWQASYDETMLELVGGKSEYKEEAKPGVVGAGGVEYFRFKALKTGNTEITLVYKRPWEEPTPQDITKVFTINIERSRIFGK
jgi:inhibitor of cysteine peptidase